MKSSVSNLAIHFAMRSLFSFFDTVDRRPDWFRLLQLKLSSLAAARRGAHLRRMKKGDRQAALDFLHFSNINPRA
jgi:hypothetical protein